MDEYLHKLHLIWGTEPSDTAQALAWIDSCVDNEAEEGLYLDFKTKSRQHDLPSPHADDRTNLAKAISGFANTGGGLLVWGVETKNQGKDKPDVATGLRPIQSLKTFATRMDALCGEVVSPPHPGVHHRAVPLPGRSDTGYLITIVPRKRDALVQAVRGDEKGYYIRSGSAFFQLPPTLIAEFYSRRPLPIIRSSLRLAPSEAVEYRETCLSAEHIEPVVGSEFSRWGECTYHREAIIRWSVSLANDGAGTAEEISFDLSLSGTDSWQLATVDLQKEYYTDSGGRRVPIFVPGMVTKFVPVDPSSRSASGQLLNRLHPGQVVEIARGTLCVPLDGEWSRSDNLHISGSVYSKDNSPNSVDLSVSISALQKQLAATFEHLGAAHPPAKRFVPRPLSRRLVLNAQSDSPGEG